jgi:O-Antigen ligase
MMSNSSYLFSSRGWLGHPRAWLVIQAMGIVLLIVVLVDVLSWGRREWFLAALLAGIGAAWMIQTPYWGVLLISTAWFAQLEFLAGIPYLVSAILVIPLGLSILRDRSIWVLRVPQIHILLVIGLLFLISTWWSEFKYPITLRPDEDETARMAREFVVHLAWLVFFLYFVTTRERLELTTAVICALITAAALSSLPAFVGSGGSIRAAATFGFAGNSNRLAYICLFATTLLWYYKFHGPTERWKTWTLPLLCVLPVIALAAGSRSGLLQMVALAAFIVKDQKGWSAAKRVCCITFIGLVTFLAFSVVSSTYVERLTTFNPDAQAVGQESLQNRRRVVLSALQMVAADPIFGAGIGNFGWVAPAFYGTRGHTHNSYLWALTSGGVGVFGLYLVLFYVTYRMLKKTEASIQPELLWLIRAMRVNLILFMIFSGFADVWLSDFLYLLIGFTIALTKLQNPHQLQLARA